MSKILKFTERYLLKYGEVLDLGELGDIVLPDYIEFDDDMVIFRAKVTYGFAGWTFSDCELIVKPDIDVENTEIEFAEDVWHTRWEDWIIMPSKTTKVIDKGDQKALEGTFFEEFINTCSEEG